MSLQEVLEYDLGKLKTITVDEIIIVNDPIQPRNGITLAYFNANLPSGGGNMDFVGTSPLIGQHYMTDSTTGDTATKSSIVEDNVSLSFDSKDLILIGDITADKYVVNGGLSTQLLAGDGSLVNISSLPTGNMVYTPVSGNIGSHYQQSSLDGQNCIESNLSEDTFNFYFGNRNIRDISSANVVGVNATNQVFVGDILVASSLLQSNALTIQDTTINESKLKINELTIKDATSTTFYQARNITDANSLTLTTPTITTNGNVTANSYAIPGGTNAFVLLADGTTAPYISGGGQGNVFLYQNSTDITVPPSITGYIQYNNVVQPSATIVYINHITQDGIDIDPFLAEIQVNDVLYIQDKNLSTNYIKYSVVSTVLVPNTYIAITVTYITAEGTGLTTFGNNHPLFFTIFTNNTVINQRLTDLETKTRYQSSATTNQTTFVNTLNTDIINANHIYQIGDGEYITDTYADAKYLQIINEANPLPITLTSTGSGTSLLNSTTNPSFTTKSLGVSTGLSIASTSTDITLTNSSPASAISVSDAGTNLSLIGSTSTNPAFTFKTLSASTGITINDITNNLQIVNNSPATIITCNDATTGISLLGSNTNPTFTFKTLVAGTDITIGDVANQLTISSTAGSAVNLTNGGASLSLVASTSANPNLKTKSVSASTGITINDVSNNLEIVNSSPASGISIATSGTGYTLWKTLANPSFVSKGLLEGTATSFNITSDSITINNTSPASAITLTNSGSGTSILNSTTNPTFTTKSLTAGTNITFTTTSTDITINSTGGTATSWDFLPMNIGIKSALLSNSSYFNLAIVPSTITINTIKFFLPDPVGSAQIVRWALYKGLITGGGAILQAQAVTTIPSSTLGIYTMTFTVEAGRSLTFNAGDAIWLGFNGSLNLQTFVSTATSDLDNCWSIATSYNAGFPATISTALSRVNTNIHVCGLFHT